MIMVGEELAENYEKTRNVLSRFLILANSFRNGLVLACSAADNSVAMSRKGVKTEMFRIWLTVNLKTAC